MGKLISNGSFALSCSAAPFFFHPRRRTSERHQCRLELGFTLRPLFLLARERNLLNISAIFFLSFSHSNFIIAFFILLVLLCTNSLQTYYRVRNSNQNGRNFQFKLHNFLSTGLKFEICCWLPLKASEHGGGGGQSKSKQDSEMKTLRRKVKTLCFDFLVVLRLRFFYPPFLTAAAFVSHRHNRFVIANGVRREKSRKTFTPVIRRL